MNKTQSLAIIALAVLAVAFVTPAANADIISYSDTFGPTGVPFSQTSVATLPQFDPSLGTLLSVTLTLDASTFAGTIAWDNEASIPSDVTLGIGAEITATAMSTLTTVALPMQTGSADDIDADNDGAADFIGTDSFGVFGGIGSDSDSDSTSVIAEMIPFIGIGTFPVMAESTVATYLTTDGGFGPIDPRPGLTEGTVTVEYEYAVPEPATMTLLAVGGLGVISRRRRRRA
jgi:hypothetical protein